MCPRARLSLTLGCLCVLTVSRAYASPLLGPASEKCICVCEKGGYGGGHGVLCTSPPIIAGECDDLYELPRPTDPNMDCNDIYTNVRPHKACYGYDKETGEYETGEIGFCTEAITPDAPSKTNGSQRPRRAW